MNLAYRNAWLWVQAMNSLSPAPLVEKSIGGPRGGHARLTEEGRRLVAEFKRERARVRETLKARR
jgi:molybdate transport system regulatory protein